jgi:hypothetical protein
MKYRKFLPLIPLIAAIPLEIAFSRPVIQEFDRVQINWSTAKIQFYGEASSVPVDGERALKNAETVARLDGIKYIGEAVKKLQEEKIELPAELKPEDPAKAVSNVRKSTYSYNTTYYANGQVRVYLENYLAKALAKDDFAFTHTNAPSASEAKNTGIVFKLAAATPPAVAYRVVDEKGEVLFQIQDVAADAFQQRMMGQWFKSATAQELEGAAGKNPVELVASPKGSDIEVKRADWQQATEGNTNLLRASKIVLLLP